MSEQGIKEIEIKLLNKSLNNFNSIVYKPNTINDIKFNKNKFIIKSFNSNKEEDEKLFKHWTQEENVKFCEALINFGTDLLKAKEYIKTKSFTQIRSHSQKFLAKLTKENILKSKGIYIENIPWIKAINILKERIDKDQLLDIFLSNISKKKKAALPKIKKSKEKIYSDKQSLVIDLRESNDKTLKSIMEKSTENINEDEKEISLNNICKINLWGKRESIDNEKDTISEIFEENTINKNTLSDLNSMIY